MKRTYLDYNATTPLRQEARQAMIEAMDVFGNPSSVHSEGRAGKKLLENARAELAEAAGVSGADIVFTSSATEAAALALKGKEKKCAGVEHPSVLAHCRIDLELIDGKINDQGDDVVRQLANSETGVLQKKARPVWFEDAVQAFGKIPYAFSWRRARMGAISAHKFGGPKGVGALLIDSSLDIEPIISGGGQEGSRRAGTENLIGIVGMGAAAKAAEKDLSSGRWEEVEEMRNMFEARILNECPDAVIAGQNCDRLPNTSLVIVPGWKGETQIMQMDLEGFAVSAGTACSSGKVNESLTLRSMGYDTLSAGSGIRVSFGLESRIDEAMQFAEAWISKYKKWKKR